MDSSAPKAAVMGPVSAMRAADLSPFHGRMSLNALVDDRISQDGHLPFLSVTASLDPFTWRHFTFGELGQLVSAATAHYASIVPPRRHGDSLRTVAVYAASSLDLFVTELALLRMGHAAAMFSPNNSVPALVHLVKATSADVVLFSPDKQSAVEQARQDLLNDVQRIIPIYPQFSTQTAIDSDALSASTKPDPNQTELSYHEQEDDKAIILHSSGSTGFPKPLSYTHAEYVNLMADDYPFDAMCTVPLFHGYGCAVVWRQFLLKRRIYLYSETLRMDLLSPAILNSQATILHAVPFTYKVIAEADGGSALLRRFDVCCYSGAPCPQEVGDGLVAEGVNLVGFLGSTEAGHMMESFRQYDSDKGWNVYRPSVRFAPHVAFENTGVSDNGPYEMVIHPGWKALIKHNRPDDSYASGDLFELIRDQSGIAKGYVYIGRGDDTLIHFSGEKTNPVPMEQRFRSSPLLRDCLVFGSAQTHTGALVVPYEAVWQQYADLAEHERQAALKRDIEDVLSDVNRQAPSHSRLVPEMIRFLPPQTVFPIADKGSVKRVAANAIFSAEIGQVYTDFDLGLSTSDQDKVEVSSLDQVTHELKHILEKFLALDRPLELNDDVTKLGADSLMDSQIRSKINRTFKLQALLPGNIVFKHPTLAKLARVVYEVAQPDANGLDVQASQKEQQAITMSIYQALRARLLPRSAVATSLNGDKETVVLTGATGSLGAHILHQLSKKAAVSIVICLNRAKSDADAEKRTEASLRERLLPSVTELERAHGSLKIVSLAANLVQPNLGLDPLAYQEILSSVTSVIHNGWPVNFNMSVESFQDALDGTVQLMNLVGQSTACPSPRFLFSSSISVALRSTESVVAEEIEGDLSNVAHMGYAQSKWIVEQLCHDAHELVSGGFDAVVMRIGQMVGDRAHGVWNESEAPPLIFKSAQTINCLPDLQESLYWLPVDNAGYIAAQLTSLPLPSQSGTSVLVHVTNEAGIPHSELLDTLAKPDLLGPTFKVVPFAEWVAKLEASDQNPARNPTIKLLQHFRDTLHEKERGDEFKGTFATTRLQALFANAGLSGEIGDRLAAYKPEYLAKTVAAWKKSGFLS